MAMHIDMINIPESLEEDNYDFKAHQLLPILEERTAPAKFMENFRQKSPTRGYFQNSPSDNTSNNL